MYSPSQQDPHKDSFSDTLPHVQTIGESQEKTSAIFDELDEKQVNKWMKKKSRMPKVIIDEDEENYEDY